MRLDLGDEKYAYAVAPETYSMLRYACSRTAKRKLYKTLHEALSKKTVTIDFPIEELTGVGVDAKGSSRLDFDTMYLATAKKSRKIVVFSSREHALVRETIGVQRKKSVVEQYIRDHMPSVEFRQALHDGERFDIGPDASSLLEESSV